MARCPKCGNEATTLIKSWPFATRKQYAKGESSIVIGLFECLNCKAKFRAALEAEAKIEETASIKNVVEKIKVIRGELMQTLKNLREKINTLETERSSLMIEIENLRKVAEARVEALEGEVVMLRQEVKSLRDLLGYTEEAEKQKQ